MPVERYDASVSAGSSRCISIAKRIRGKGTNNATIMMVVMPALVRSWKRKEMSHDASIMVKIMRKKTIKSINIDSYKIPILTMMLDFALFLLNVNKVAVANNQ